MSEQGKQADGRIFARIKEAGILVTIPGDLPLERVTMVADALLAAPVLAVEVTYRDAAGLRLVTDLRRRARDLLVVGMAEIETAVQVAAAAAAGAAFISSSRLDNDVLQACQARAIGYIPTVISVWAAQAAMERACRMVRLRTGGPQGGEYLQAVQEVVPELDFLLEVIDLQLSDVDNYAALGAAGLVTGHAVYAGDGQPMGDIISRARQMQQAWQQADGGVGTGSKPKPGREFENGNLN